MLRNPQCHFCCKTDLETISSTYAFKLVCGNSDFKTMLKEAESMLQSPFTVWCNYCMSVFLFSSWCEKNDCNFSNPVNAEGLLATLAFYKTMSLDDQNKIYYTQNVLNNKTL